MWVKCAEKSVVTSHIYFNLRCNWSEDMKTKKVHESSLCCLYVQKILRECLVLLPLKHFRGWMKKNPGLEVNSKCMCDEIPANSVVPLPHCTDLKPHCCSLSSSLSLSLCLCVSLPLSLSTKPLSVKSCVTLRPTEFGNLTPLKEKHLPPSLLSGPSL